MNKVTVLSMSEANYYIPKGKASIIRISDTSLELNSLPFPYNKCLTMGFYDIIPRIGLPSNWNWFNASDGELLLKMFKSLTDEEELVIHCHAGISRSPAVALSFAWFKDDMELEDEIINGKYIPNTQVLKVMAHLIGIYKSKRDVIRGMEII